MEEFRKELQKWFDRVKDLENAFYRIKVLIFPTDDGKFVLPKYDGDPPSPQDGEMWLDYTAGKIRKREGGVSKDLEDA